MAAATIAHELERAHCPEAPLLADGADPGDGLVEPGLELGCDGICLLAELRGPDLFEHGPRGDARERVADERTAQSRGMHGVHQLVAPRDRGDRQAAAFQITRQCELETGPVRPMPVWISSST